ncbi:MAG: 30S ribosomal protein S5 [Candidatus Roizmanbacteria bacterium]|nr:30S ribosomal protein S5 [Candidatus Roizmanbacteria bacterium]
MIKRRQKSKEESEYDERVLTIRRVSKKTTGGNYVTFSALVAVGDGKGNVGVGLGRGREVPPAINKGITQAKRRMVHLPIFNDTIPHEIRIKYKSSRLLLKPAPPGSGLKLGGVVRSIMDIAGIQNASGKIIGSRNQITNAYAVIEAIKQLKPRIVKGKTISAEKPQEVSEVKADVVEKPEVKKVSKPTVKKPTKKVAKKKPTKEKSA